MAHPFSLRLDASAVDRLNHRAAASNIAARTLAQRYVEEGLRRDEHPQIHFVDGRSGRRAGVVGTGLDVWEVVATVRDNEGDIAAAAEYLAVPAGTVDAAVTYYGAFRTEIDAEIALNTTESARAHDAFVAGRRALRA
jgi:uncharacterized protein (DUF433 family)